MKLLLDIHDNKAPFVMELLKQFRFVKTKKLSSNDAEVLEGMKDAVDEVSLIKKCRKEAKSLNKFLNENF